MRVTMIDNYDSFTYNLVQYLQELGVNVTTYRNDKVSVSQVLNEEPDFIVISPGPSSPEQSGICPDLILESAKSGIPLLGICLGHQAIAWAFGGQIIKINPPVHGKVSRVTHKNIGVFKGLPDPLDATRYHSLVVEPASLPDCLEVTARTEDGTIMGLRHKSSLIEGLQFHPESVLTIQGKAMIKAFKDEVLIRQTSL